MDPSPAARTDRTLPLRERKKLRMRQDLSETALRLFLERGFDATTLDDLVDAVEVSKRTFFRYFASKEAVALAAETDLWDACAAELSERELRGHLLTVLRDALTATVAQMGDEWLRRFLATRGLIARTPALRDRSDLTSLAAQRRIAEVLEARLNPASQDGLRLRLLAEVAMSAWRCGARNWVRGPKAPDAEHKVAGLVREIGAAFDAIPGTVTLSVP